MQTRIVVEIQGGCVMNVYCSDGQADCRIVDYDELNDENEELNRNIMEGAISDLCCIY